MKLFGNKKRIYLDYASLTPVDPRAIRETKRYSSSKYANPSSLYKEGVAAKKAMEDGRKRVADFMNAHADEIVFTSGGTESNGLALEGASRTAHKNGIEKPHLIISSIEHSSIIECANMMEKHGVEVTRLSVNKEGLISLEELKKALKPSTFLVSIMMVNNEIGTIEPIREIAKVIRHYRSSKVDRGAGDLSFQYPLLHTDASQAALYSELDVEKLGADLMTLDGSKVYGPRGIGALYIRRSTPIEPIIYGGGQERGLRSGTENLPPIMGLAKAFDIASEIREKEATRISDLRQYFIKQLQSIRPVISINGSEDSSVCSPHIINVTIPGIDNEFFVLQLDVAGIACSTKSSCLRDADESYVLKAIGATSGNSIRFSFGRWTTSGDIERVIHVTSKLLKRA